MLLMSFLHVSVQTDLQKVLSTGATEVAHHAKTTDLALPPRQVIIVQSDNRELSCSEKSNHYPTLSAVINYLYAKQHQYNYIRYQYVSEIDGNVQQGETDSVKTEATCESRASPWCKILSVYDALKNLRNGHDIAVFVDSDAAFIQPSVSIMDYLNTTEFAEGRDNRDSSIIITRDYPYHPEPHSCTGMFMVKNNDIAKEILKQWWINGNRFPDFFHKHPFEQETWNKYININQNYSSHIGVLKDYSLTERAIFLRHAISKNLLIFDIRNSFHQPFLTIQGRLK